MDLIKIVPLGGLGEIGMNCMVLETESDLFLIDCGVLFTQLEMFGVSVAIPDFSYVLERQDKLRAIWITHGHEDHIGGLVFALKFGLRAPIYGSAFTLLLVREKLKEAGLLESTELHTITFQERIHFGEISVEFVSVNHSIVESCALFVHTPWGSIIHTGDFKIDPTPFFESMMDMAMFKRQGDAGVLLLMSDSTNVERCDLSLSEKVVYEKFEFLLQQSSGLTLVSMFASNVSRMGQIFELAKKLDKKIVLAGRSMEQNVRLAVESGYLDPSVVIPIQTMQEYNRQKLIVLSTGSQGEPRSSLIRIARNEHPFIKLAPEDLVLMSSKFIPGNEKAIGSMINQLFRLGAEVLYEAMHDIHVSGHATKFELKQMLEAVRPRFFIPIHGEYRHLVHHAALARECGVLPQNVILAENGSLIYLTPEKCFIKETLPRERVYIDAAQNTVLSAELLKHRRNLAKTGIVIPVLESAVSFNDWVFKEMLFYGIVDSEQQEAWVVQAENVVCEVLKEFSKRSVANAVIEEQIRIRLRRAFNEKLGSKPVVIPVIT
jgi:ribonuclease J